MKFIPHSVLLNLALLIFPLALFSQPEAHIKTHTEYLASDKLEGRGTGSKGIRMAAEYIAGQFRAIGLKGINGDSYFQNFPIPDQREMESNVVGIIEAGSPSSKSIVFTAHYDAYGTRNEEGQTDSIYNGARDNAVGVAALIELARMFKQDGPPGHNLVFMATSAEEFGQHGSNYYVEHPVFPTEEIIICLNIDGFNVTGPREDYFVFPRQGVDFVDEIETLLAPLGWHYISPDWVDQMNTSFDTASFLKEGIPALTLWTGDRLKGGQMAEPPSLGGIHSPDDEVTALWDWEGVEDHLQLYKVIAEHFLKKPGGISVTDPTLFTKQ